MSLKVKGEWVAWENVTIDQIRAEIAVGAIKRDELRKLLYGHKFNNEVTGWVFKYINPLRAARTVDGKVRKWGPKSPYLFE